MTDAATGMVIGVIVISLTAGAAILSLAEELQGRADHIANETGEWGGRVADAVHGLFHEGKTLHGDFPDLMSSDLEVNETIAFYEESAAELEALNESSG
jgi:hypothetical protein